MSEHTGISWTGATWNPVVGCTKVSQGCKHCYAKTLHDQRHKAYLAGKRVPAQYAHPFETVQLLPERLTAPDGWRVGLRVFVNSMSDLFHEDVPFDFIALVWAAMVRNPRHEFQVLTKRPVRMREFVTDCWPKVPPNVWLGTSVEDMNTAVERIPFLLQTPAAVRFLSCEPLLGPIELFGAVALPFRRIEGEEADGTGPIDWVIVGGESGSNFRPMEMEWLERIVSDCRASGIPVFVKQDSGPLPGKQGRIPPDLWIHEFPGSPVLSPTKEG